MYLNVGDFVRTGTFVVVGFVLVPCVHAHAQAEAICDVRAESHHPPLVIVVAPDGATATDAWFLYAKGRPAAGQPPRRCDPRDGDCLDHPKIPIDSGPFELLGTVDGWSCLVQNGPGYVWVRTANVKPIVLDPHPTLSAWLGRWVRGEGYVNISSDDGSQLQMEGKNTWHGLGDVIHFGQIVFENVRPSENPITLDKDGCEVTMTLAGSYLLLHDNEGCGGMNVRFQGAWKRDSAK